MKRRRGASRLLPGNTERMDQSPITIYVDADACPVKQEVYRVAERHGLKVYVVSNSPIAVPRDPLIERVVVAAGMDAADDWIAERVAKGAIVVTQDIPLAARAVKAGAVAIAPNGKPFDESSIGMTLATRNLMDSLRSAGEITGGPRPFAAKDRSAFLQSLEREIVRLKRAGFG
ncbi:MAG TPA: YaiI/YqxD family protein [Burkholderiales bacterium]|nr:YaiI/YqxD family protein [Burkholderiales bacterium]